MATENRLIDKMSAVKLLRGKCVAKYPSSFLMGLLAAATEIEQSPDVDAVEVVHGEWVVCGDGEYVPFMCSVCGKTTSWYHAQTANYCPNCGAKMDLKGE